MPDAPKNPGKLEIRINGDPIECSWSTGATHRLHDPEIDKPTNVKISSLIFDYDDPPYTGPHGDPPGSKRVREAHIICDDINPGDELAASLGPLEGDGSRRLHDYAIALNILNQMQQQRGGKLQFLEKGTGNLARETVMQKKEATILLEAITQSLAQIIESCRT